jgi:Fe-S-cluster containining protein
MPGGDELVQIVDAAAAEAVRRGGHWIACRLGCTACCLGPFPITPRDAARLRAGLDELASRDADRAAHIRERARAWRGVDDEPCPALHPATGACDLYDARPLTCRLFGPAVRGPDGSIAVCELCFEGADDVDIADCAVEFDLEALDPDADETTIAAALIG